MRSVRVIVIGGNNIYTIVEYNKKKYQVANHLLTNHISQSTSKGFINYAWINPLNLQREWNP